MTERCSMHLSSDNNLDRNCNLLSLEQIGSEKGLSCSVDIKSAQKRTKIRLSQKSQFTNVQLN